MNRVKKLLFIILILSSCKQSNKAFNGQNWEELADSFGKMHLFDPQLKEQLNIEIDVNGVGGSTIATGFDNAERDGIHRLSFIERLNKSLAQKSDRVLLITGGNDWYYSVPVGKPTDTTTNTYYGALNFIAKSALTKHKKMTWVTMIKRDTKRKNGATPGSVNFEDQKKYVDAMIAVGKENGIQVINAFEDSGINYRNSIFTTKDGAHPNWLGKRLYVTMLIKEIK